MILLHPDCMILRMSDGKHLPHFAESIAGDLHSSFDMSTELVHHAAFAVLHYFKKERGQDVVSFTEFSKVLKCILQKWTTKSGAQRTHHADLFEMLSETEWVLELAIFQCLRVRMRDLIRSSPVMIRFSGLRESVKRVLRARRWSAQCQTLNDQIVAFLRKCLDADSISDCAFIVKG